MQMTCSIIKGKGNGVEVIVNEIASREWQRLNALREEEQAQREAIVQREIEGLRAQLGQTEQHRNRLLTEKLRTPRPRRSRLRRLIDAIAKEYAWTMGCPMVLWAAFLRLCEKYGLIWEEKSLNEMEEAASAATSESKSMICRAYPAHAAGVGRATKEDNQ